MIVAATAAERRGEQIARRLEGRLFGSTTRVQRASLYIAPDWDDEISAYVDVVLGDPEGETWPVDDVLGIRLAALELARDVGLDLMVYVRLSSESDHQQADDDPTILPS